MCDEALEKIKGNDALMSTATSRYEIDPEHMHPDTEKHILLFDIIYCCSTYRLFDGIHYVVPKNAERQLMQAKKEKAVELKKALDDAKNSMSQLNEVQNRLFEAVTVGKTVKHKSFGIGSITGVNNGRFIIAFEHIGAKELGIKMCVINNLISMDGLALTTDQMTLLKDEEKIRNALSRAEKAITPYWEFLD